MVKITDKVLDKIVDQLLGLNKFEFKNLCEDCANTCKSDSWEVIDCRNYVPRIETEEIDIE